MEQENTKEDRESKYRERIYELRLRLFMVKKQYPKTTILIDEVLAADNRIARRMGD